MASQKGQTLLEMILRFGIVGVVVTVFNFVAFIALLQLGLRHLPATALSWLPSVGLAYVLNRRKTFDMPGPMQFGEMMKYAAASVLQLGLSLADMAVLVDGLSVPPSIACLLNIAVVSGSNFLVLKCLVFRSNAPASGPEPASIRP